MLRATLTNTDFVKALYNNSILVWGGDVRDLEAWNGTSDLSIQLIMNSNFVFLSF
jgi:hypothetical protein